MNTEPPTGDELQQMLVSMKQDVLARAHATRPAPRRRGRRAGIVIGVIAVLGIGATSGGVALGMIPQPFAAAPAPSPAPSEPTVTPSESSAPVVERPTTAPPQTPAPTSTRPPYALDDPSTWTISGDEVGPVAIGGATAAETDDMLPAYREDHGGELCMQGTGSAWHRDGAPDLVIWSRDDRVIGVVVWNPDPGDSTPLRGPTTAAGIGVGSTLDEFRAAYPQGVRAPSTGDVPSAATPDSYTVWTAETGSGPVVFHVGADGTHITSIDSGEDVFGGCD